MWIIFLTAEEIIVGWCIKVKEIAMLRYFESINQKWLVIFHAWRNLGFFYAHSFIQMQRRKIKNYIS